MKVNKGFKVKRLKKMRECNTTLERVCNCCTDDATVEIIFLKTIKNKTKKEKVTIRLCDKDLKDLKEVLNYF